MKHVVHAACPHDCPDACGVRITVENGRTVVTFPLTNAKQPAETTNMVAGPLNGSPMKITLDANYRPAQVEVTYNGRKYVNTYSGYADLNEADYKADIFMPNKAVRTVNGQTILAWGVKLPANVTSLNFTTALGDLPDGSTLFGPVGYSGVEFSVRVNGKVLFSRQEQAAGWNAASVNISAYAGQNVLIELAVDSLRTDIFDYAYWTEISIQ